MFTLSDDKWSPILNKMLNISTVDCKSSGRVEGEGTLKTLNSWLHDAILEDICR